MIPARNEAEFIIGAIASYLEQAYPADLLACIAVDNGSSDATAASIIRLADEHSQRSISLVYEGKEGVGWAKNAGAAAATQSILIFLDADSRMAPNLTLEVAREYRSGHLAGSIHVAADCGTWVDRAFFKVMEFGKVRFGIRAQMFYCDRALFESLGGFNPDFKLGEDTDFLKRAARALRSRGLPPVCHVTSSKIATSPRRMAAKHHLGMLIMFARWLLAFLRWAVRRGTET